MKKHLKAIIVLFVFTIVLMFIFGLQVKREIDRRYSLCVHNCQNNLRQIEAAKLQYMNEYNIESGTILVIDQYDEINKRMEKVPVCKKGGVYSYNSFCIQPTCSFGAEHTISTYRVVYDYGPSIK